MKWKNSIALTNHDLYGKPSTKPPKDFISVEIKSQSQIMLSYDPLNMKKRYIIKFT